MSEDNEYWALRDRAEELYVEVGLTYAELAEQLDAGISTLKSWGRKGHWRRKKGEFREAQRALRQNLQKLRSGMVQKALGSMEPQDVFAALRLEKMARDTAKKDATAAPEIDRPRLFLEALEFTAGVLRERDPEGLKVFARNFEEIVRQFKKKADEKTT